MGAGRGRIARQLMTESIVLAVVGGLAGLTIAMWGTSAFTALPDVPRIDTITIDARVLGFALFASVLTGLVFGLAPMIQLFGGDLYAALRQGRGVSGGRMGERVRRTVIVAEISLALLLLAGAGLLARSFLALQSVDPGYRTDGVLAVRLSLPTTTYPEESQRLDFFENLVARVGDLPGVREAGAVSNLPLASGLGDLNFRIEGRDVAAGDVSPRADWQVVTPGYFDAMGMRVLRGRAITAEDREGTPGVVVISEEVARRYWPDSDPLGARFQLGGRAGPGMVTIVGIVADIRHASLDAPIDPQMYLAHRQFRFWNGGSVVNAMTVVAHTAGDPASLATAVRGAIATMNPQLPVSTVATMAEVTAASVAQPRFLMSLLLIFAAAAMTLAAVGVYGVMAYAVARRSHELSIRVALGARASAVAGMVVRQGLVLVGVGLAIGLVAALALTRLLGSLLYGVSATDPLTLAGASAVLATVALLACWIPARRATRADPMEALRAE
jgi:putative ABC transport system permease protein